MRTDRLPIAEEIVRKICEANDYSHDSGVARGVVEGLWKLPLNMLQRLHTLVVLGNRWDATWTKALGRGVRKIKHAPELLESIGRQVHALALAGGRGSVKLDCVGVRLYVDGAELLDTDLGRAIEWIAGDVYFDENTNWSSADRAEVYVF
jgi:hypothetical protein